MAYTIGASHGPFTGQGNFIVAKPAGIRTVVTGIPSHTGHDGGSPRRYFKLGRFTMGNTDGFQFSHGLEYAQQLLYPMPLVWELLAYDVKDGASCLFQELVDVPDLSLKQPWDRTPLPVALGGPGATSGGGGTTTTFTYTVPVGRRFMLAKAQVRLRRWTAASALNYCQATITLNGATICYAFLINNAIGSETADEQQSSGLVLRAGDILAATVNDNSTGGSVHFAIEANGTLFDA